MTDKRFIIEEADSGRSIEMSIADTSKVNFTLNDFRDFWDSEEEVSPYNISPYHKYLEYLWSNEAFLTVNEAEELLNYLADRSRMFETELDKRCQISDVLDDLEKKERWYWQTLTDAVARIAYIVGCESEKLVKPCVGNCEDAIEQLSEDCRKLIQENQELEKENKKLLNISNMKKGALTSAVNQLTKENEKLKSQVNDTQVAVEIETEKCMQRVFDIIDKHTKYWSKKYDLAGVDALLRLKKELKE